MNSTTTVSNISDLHLMGMTLVCSRTIRDRNWYTNCYFQSPNGMIQRMQIDDESNSHPIHRLPPEILSIIFWHAIPRDKGFVLPSTRRAPLLLRQVCTSWRSIADRTPELWASIELFVFRPYTKAVQAHQSWISKSGNSFLDMKLVFMASEQIQYSRSSYRPLEDFVMCIKCLRSRWRNVALSAPRFITDILLDDQHAFPVLEELAISDALHTLADMSWDSGELKLTKAPKLRRLRVLEPLRVHLGSIPSAISCLQFKVGPQSQISSILKVCPRLEELTINFGHNSPKEIAYGQHFSFPHLHTLTVTFWDSNQSSQHCVLSKIHAPALRKLALERMKAISLSCLTALLDQSEGGVDELALSSVQLGTEDFASCFTRTPLLRSLRIVDQDGLGDQFLERLIWRPSSNSNVLPQLTKLWLLRCSCSQMDVDLVIQLIRSRSLKATMSESIAPLKELRFDGTQAQQSMLYNNSDVQASVEGGLTLYKYVTSSCVTRNTC